MKKGHHCDLKGGPARYVSATNIIILATLFPARKRRKAFLGGEWENLLDTLIGKGLDKATAHSTCQTQYIQTLVAIIQLDGFWNVVYIDTVRCACTGTSR